VGKGKGERVGCQETILHYSMVIGCFQYFKFAEFFHVLYLSEFWCDGFILFLERQYQLRFKGRTRCACGVAFFIPGHSKLSQGVSDFRSMFVCALHLLHTSC